MRASVGTRVFFRLDPTGADPGVRALDSAKLAPEVRDQLARAEPSFSAPPELPVTAGERRDLLTNELGLLIVSDGLKKLLARQVKGLAFAPIAVRSKKKKESYWLTSSRKAIDALAEPCHGDSPVLDANRVAGAPALFRLADPDRRWYLIDRDLISEILEAGHRTGILAHGALFGRPLAR